MNGMTEKILVCFAMFSAVGWVILLFWIGARFSRRRQREQERAGTTGRIAEYKDAPGRGRRRGKKIPVVEYTVLGETYRQEAEGFLNPAEHPVGGEVEVHYDAGDPRRFHLGPETGLEPAGRAGLRFSLLWIAGSLALTLALAKFVGGADFSVRNLQRYLRDPGSLFAEPKKEEPSTLEADGFVYSVRDELWACLEGCTDSGRTSLELPRLLGGCFVRYIRPAAFSAMRSVETARIHGGIESVPAGAFSGCLSLRELTVEEGVRSLGVMAFSFCMALQDVTLPASLTYIPDNAFPEGCSAVFRVPKESEAERYCLEKGFKVAYTE